MTLKTKLLKVALENPGRVRTEVLKILANDEQRSELSYHGLDGLFNGSPVTLYHGTTASFKAFDLNKSRLELVDDFYGKGIFLTPSKRVAESYAEANRNIGFPPEIIDDLSRVNRNAAAFLRTLYKMGTDGWEHYWKEHGFWIESPRPNEGHLDRDAFDKHLNGVDPNTLGDIASYIVGSKKVEAPSESDIPINIFNQSTGAPSWIYDALDEIGLDSKVYRPKVYTVTVMVENTFVTANQTEARQAKSHGYDCVVFTGSGLVRGVPEVALYDTHKIKITHIEVVD